MKKLFFGTAFILLFFLSCNKIQNSADRTIISLDQYIQFKMKRDNIPGLFACFVNDKQILWAKGYGKADINKNLSITENSVFGVASISKIITATAVMQLIEQNKIKIDEPVDKYLPFKIQHPVHADLPITIAQLLSHTSTINNGPSLWRSYTCEHAEIDLNRWARSYFLPGGEYYDLGNFAEWKPSEQFLYSNAGYALLAYLVEVVSNLPLDQYCEQNIFVPLKMKNTSFNIARLKKDNLVTKYSYGYTWDLERELIQQGTEFKDILLGNYFFPLCNYSSPTFAAGGLYSSALDLSIFLRMLMNSGNFKNKNILSPKSVKKILSNYVDSSLLPGQFAGFGLGGYAMKLNNEQPVWGHTGADPGTSTFMLYNKEIKLGAIVLANRFVDIRDLIEWMFAEGFAMFCVNYTPPPSPVWHQYSGNTVRKKITVSVKPNYLPGGSQLYVIGNHRYFGRWVNSGIPLEPQNNGTWNKSFYLTDSSKIEFKITRGSFENEAVNFSDGSPIPKLMYTVKRDTVFNIVVEDWKDLWQ